MSMENISQTFDNDSISVVGKIFLAGIASALLGIPSNIKIRGTPDEIAVFKDALQACKEFQDELKNPDATVQSIMNKHENKKIAVSEFSDCFGLPWPL